MRVVMLMVSAPRRYPAIEENTTLRDNPILVISLKSVITEAVDTEDFVVLKLYVFSSILSECEDSLKIDSNQRKTLVLIGHHWLLLVYLFL
jgi:hypothetical protein